MLALSFTYNTYALITLINAWIALAAGSFAWRKRPLRCATALAYLLFACALYSFGYSLELASTELSWIKVWLKIEYLGIATLPAFFLWMILEYTGHQRWVTLPRLGLLFIIPCITLVLNYTNNWHHLYYQQLSLDTNSSLVLLNIQPAFWYWVHAAYIQFAMLFGAVLLLRSWNQSPKFFHRQIIVLLIASLLPAAIYMGYLTGKLPFAPLDPVPFAISVVGVLSFYAIFHLKILDAQPIAMDLILAELRDGVIVLDANRKILLYNTAAADLIARLDADNLPTHDYTGYLLDNLFKNWSTFLDAINEQKQDIELLLNIQDTSRWFAIRTRQITVRSSLHQNRLIQIRDITERIHATLELHHLNEALEATITQRTAELNQMRSRLADRIVEQNNQLTGLYEVITISGQSKQLDQILTESLQKVIDLFKGDLALLLENNGENHHLSVSASLNINTNQIKRVSRQSGSCLFHLELPVIIHKSDPLGDIQKYFKMLPFEIALVSPIHLGNKVTGFLGVFWQQSYSLNVDEIALFSAVANHLGIIMDNIRLRQRIADTAIQSERRRLARDLHDSVMQSLHSLVLFADITANRLHNQEHVRAEESLLQLAESARQALKEMRLLLFEMRLAPLEELQLTNALQLRLEAVEQRAGVDGRLLLTQPTQWPPEWDPDLYCIAMEALNNSLKHANAHHVSVELSGDRCNKLAWVDLKVRDDGIGFDHHQAQVSGMGLRNMQERATRLGGELTIQSEPQQGTTIHLTIKKYREKMP